MWLNLSVLPWYTLLLFKNLLPCQFSHFQHSILFPCWLLATSSFTFLFTDYVQVKLYHFTYNVTYDSLFLSCFCTIFALYFLPVGVINLRIYYYFCFKQLITFQRNLKNETFLYQHACLPILSLFILLSGSQFLSVVFSFCLRTFSNVFISQDCW